MKEEDAEMSRVEEHLKCSAKLVGILMMVKADDMSDNCGASENCQRVKSRQVYRKQRNKKGESARERAGGAHG